MLVGRSATELAELVRSREVTAVAVVRAHLDHLDRVDPRLGAFVRVRRDVALAEAAEVDQAAEGDEAAEGTARDRLPLAGVPVAVKDVVDVAGEPTRHGSLATSDAPAAADDPLVQRLRRAGAVIVGKTRTCELAVWGTSDDAEGIAVSPWDPTRSAGGSSGGSGAAVAAGVVPVALGTDGLGSVRIPAAACGVAGMRPGSGEELAVRVDGRPHWFGMTRHGPLATTVTDLALVLDVLRATDDLREIPAGDRPGRLHVAVSWRSPMPAGTVSSPWRDAVLEAGRLLRHAGHTVTRADPPVDARAVQAVTTRWTAGPAEHAQLLELDHARLEPRTRAHLARGARLVRVRGVREDDARRWRRTMAPFFAEHDVLITPAFARAQPLAHAWHRRSWAANVGSNLATYPFTPGWNLGDNPAAVVPLGQHGPRPLAIQIVAGVGRDDLVLAAAADLERALPWTRHAPGWIGDAGAR